MYRYPEGFCLPVGLQLTGPWSDLIYGSTAAWHVLFLQRYNTFCRATGLIPPVLSSLHCSCCGPLHPLQLLCVCVFVFVFFVLQTARLQVNPFSVNKEGPQLPLSSTLRALCVCERVKTNLTWCRGGLCSKCTACSTPAINTVIQQVAQGKHLDWIELHNFTIKFWGNMFLLENHQISKVLTRVTDFWSHVSSGRKQMKINALFTRRPFSSNITGNRTGNMM